MLGIAFGPFSVGLCKGYSSPALASLRSADNVQTGSSTSTESTTAAFNVTSTSLIRITEQEGSWIASLSLLGALFGALLSSQVQSSLTYRPNYGVYKTIIFAISFHILNS